MLINIVNILLWFFGIIALSFFHFGVMNKYGERFGKE